MLSLITVPIVLAIILYMLYTTVTVATPAQRKTLFKAVVKSIVFMMIAFVIIACFVFIF